MAEKRPILFLSDAVSGSSGLSRIARDLSTRVHEHLGDLYRVASFGYGSPGSSKIPFQQFVIEGMSEWVMPTLPDVCADFFGKEKGIICTVFDAHRLTWLASPRGCSELFSKFPGLQAWAMSRPFSLWGYLPVDSSGPNDRLTFPIMKTLLGFDRLIAYGQFGEGVIRRTIGDEESDKRHLTNIPHGIDGEIFYELPRKLSRKLFLEYTGAQNFFQMIGQMKVTTPIDDEEILIGCVATNQTRKNHALAAETVAILSKTHRLRFWLHTDELERYWSIPNLLADYGLLDKTIISLGQITDSKLAAAYSACDLTLGIGPEGFGLPLLESQYCGCPVVTGAYAGGSDIVPKEWQVNPIGFYKEGSYASLRPVYKAEDWADMAELLIGQRCNYPGEYAWDRLWPEQWEPYLREAAK
jgi:glycosyltransferase involved in cell wall biosynthesis